MESPSPVLFALLAEDEEAPGLFAVMLAEEAPGLFAMSMLALLLAMSMLAEDEEAPVLLALAEDEEAPLVLMEDEEAPSTSKGSISSIIQE